MKAIALSKVYHKYMLLSDVTQPWLAAGPSVECQVAETTHQTTRMDVTQTQHKSVTLTEGDKPATDNIDIASKHNDISLPALSHVPSLPSNFSLC